MYRLTDTGHDLFQTMLRDADPALLADENEFQVRVSFFADVPPEEQLRIIAVRRDLVRAQIDHLDSLRPEAAAGPWGLRVMDFHRDNARRELHWLDDLATAAGTGTGDRHRAGPGAGRPAGRARPRWSCWPARCSR